MGLEKYDARDAIFTTGSTWWVCENYDLFEYEDELYIKAYSLKGKEYNPFEVKDSIIKDFINISQNIPGIDPKEVFPGMCIFYSMNKEQQKSIARRILGFVKKYGLLGLISYLLHSKQQDKRLKNHYNSELTRIPDILLFVREIAILRECRINENLTLDEINKEMSLFTETFFPKVKYQEATVMIENPNKNNRNPTMSELFTQVYAEPVGLIFDKVLEMYQYIKMNDPERPEQGELETIRTGAISVELVPGKSSQIGWNFNSLIDAMLIVLCQNTLITGQLVKICENCGSAFITKKSVAKYCCNACGNLVRVCRFRNKV